MMKSRRCSFVVRLCITCFLGVSCTDAEANTNGVLHSRTFRKHAIPEAAYSKLGDSSYLPLVNNDVLLLDAPRKKRGTLTDLWNTLTGAKARYPRGYDERMGMMNGMQMNGMGYGGGGGGGGGYGDASGGGGGMAYGGGNGGGGGMAYGGGNGGGGGYGGGGGGGGGGGYGGGGGGGYGGGGGGGYGGGYGMMMTTPAPDEGGTDTALTTMAFMTFGVNLVQMLMSAMGMGASTRNRRGKIVFPWFSGRSASDETFSPNLMLRQMTELVETSNVTLPCVQRAACEMRRTARNVGTRLKDNINQVLRWLTKGRVRLAPSIRSPAAKSEESACALLHPQCSGPQHFLNAVGTVLEKAVGISRAWNSVTQKINEFGLQ